jgi:hypothetical protein
VWHGKTRGDERARKTLHVLLAIFSWSGHGSYLNAAYFKLTKFLLCLLTLCAQPYVALPTCSTMSYLALCTSDFHFFQEVHHHSNLFFWGAFKLSGTRSCCLLLQYLIQSCARGGRRIVEDMCYEIRRAEACVD